MWQLPLKSVQRFSSFYLQTDMKTAIPTFSQLFISGATKLPTEGSVTQYAANLTILAVIRLVSHIIIIIRVIKSRRIRWGEHIKHMGKRSGSYRVLVGNLDRDHVEDPGVDGRIILRWIFRKWDGLAWIGLIWLGIGTGGGHLITWQWTFRFRKMRGISLLAENRLASQEGLCFME